MLYSVFLILLFHIETAHWLRVSAPDGVLGLPTGDFSNLWAAGSLSRTRRFAVLYDPAAFQAWKAAAFGHPVLRNDWVYPPLVLPLAAVVSLLPLPLGFVLWSVGTIAGMVALLRRAGLGGAAVSFVLCSPANCLCLIYGQFGGLLGCLVVTSLVLAGRRPILAGVMLGLAALKPQLGLLTPLALCVRGRWRALGAGAATCLVLAALPAGLFGGACWRLYLTSGLAAARHLVVQPFGAGYQLTGTSVFWMFRSCHAGVALAAFAQIAAALAAAVAVIAVWRRDNDPLVRAALTAILMPLVAPYGFAADMVGYSIGLAVLTARRGGVTLGDSLLWLAPGYAALAAAITGRELMPLVVLAATLRFARR